MSENFLNRWSRLKQEAASLPEVQEQHPEAKGGLLSEEDIAALPRPEDLTAESDITCFLRAGVPDELRKAALRKIWLLDPAIRDFEGHARDYAYDWNVVGNVPGSGLLDAKDDVAAMLRDLLGEPEAPEATAEEPSGDEVTAPQEDPSLS